jgi:hypothetical protein
VAHPWHTWFETTVTSDSEAEAHERAMSRAEGLEVSFTRTLHVEDVEDEEIQD